MVFGCRGDLCCVALSGLGDGACRRGIMEASQIKKRGARRNTDGDSDKVLNLCSQQARKKKQEKNMFHSRCSESSQPLNSKDVNKHTTARTSKHLNSDTILKTDSPRTCELKTLRAKRLAYFVDRNHNCTNTSTAVGGLGFDDQQANIDHTTGGPQSENLLNAEQNVSVIEKELDNIELVQHMRIQDIRDVHCTGLETSLTISESDEKATCMPKPDYNFLENPTVSEIQKLRHILCWAQKILKKNKRASNTQVYQNNLTVNETELAESHLNPDISQPATFNWSSNTNKSMHSGPVSSRFDDTNYSADISSESCSSHDLFRSSRTLVQTSSFSTSLNVVQGQCTSTNTDYSSKHHFDSNNILERKYAEQVNTCNVSSNNWKFNGSGESKVLVTRLPNENCHSMTGNVSALNKDNYFWIPLEGGSDDEYVTGNRQMKKASLEPFVKNNITPLLCSSNNLYHNNEEPTLSAGTVTLRKSPTAYYSSRDVLASLVNLHNSTQYNISSNNHNNNWEPTLSARTVTLRNSPVTYCYSSGDILASSVNLHNAAPHYNSTVGDKEKHNYAWKAKSYHEISLEDSKIADVPRVLLNLDDAGFNLKSPIDFSVFPDPCKGTETESSNETTPRNKKDKGTNLVKASLERPNSDQFPEKLRNLCITNSNKSLLSCSSISPKYCTDVILDSRGSKNLPVLKNYLLKKEGNCNNDENDVKYQITASNTQNALKLSSLPLLSSYDFNDSKQSSLQLEKESIESEIEHITEENSDSFLHASHLVRLCPECKSDNSSTVNWCTECGCVLIGIAPRYCDGTSNVDGRVFSNPRGSPNKDKINTLLTKATDGLKDNSETVESEIYDFKDSKGSTCFTFEIHEPQLSVYQKYLLYMEHLEKIRLQHQTKEQQQTDVLLVKENTNQTETVDADNSSCGKREPENSNFAIFKVSTHFPDQTDRKHIVYEQDSEDNPIPKSDIGTISLAENASGVSVLHCGLQEKNYLQQNNNVEISKNILHSSTLKQNFGNQNITSLEYENNKETLKDAGKKTGRRKIIQSSIDRYQRCWEKSSIAWSSYTNGRIKARSTNVNHPRSVDDGQRAKGKPLLRDGHSAVLMTKSKWSWKQPIKRPLSDNILDNKQASQEAQRSKIPLQNTAVASRPTMKQREISKYFRNNSSQSCEKLICRGNDNCSPWLYLPDEIWIRIFTLLPHRDLCQVAQVCYCFYRLANDETLWKDIKVENSNCLNDEWLKNIGHHQPQSLSLCRCKDRTKSITDSGLKELFMHCKDSLKELYVTCCSGPQLTGDSILLHASAVCHKLTSVDVSWTAATDKGIIALAQASSCLYRLRVNGCHLTNESINILIKKHGKSLRELELFGCHALSTHSLTDMAQECLNLQILNIGRIPKLTTACLIQIVTSLKNLTALNLSGLNAVHDSVVHHTARQCPKMDRLILSSCPQLTDVSLFEIGTYLSTIRHLDVSGCKKVTDTGVQALAMSCHKLHYLDLSSTATGKYGICLLASYCNKNLECVKLSFCKEITEDVIKKLCKNSKQLKLLHLYGCQSIHNLKAIQDANKQVKLHHDFSPSSVKKQEC